MSAIVGHHDQPVEPAFGLAGIDRLGGECKARLQIFSFAGDDKRRRGIEQRRRRGTPFACPPAPPALPAHWSPRRRRAAASGLTLRKPTSSGAISKLRMTPFSSADNAGRAGRRDLVEPVGAVHHPDAFGAEIFEDLRQRLGPLLARTRRPSAA